MKFYLLNPYNAVVKISKAAIGCALKSSSLSRPAELKYSLSIVTSFSRMCRTLSSIGTSHA